LLQWLGTLQREHSKHFSCFLLIFLRYKKHRDISVGTATRLRNRHTRNRSSLSGCVIRFIFSHKAYGQVLKHIQYVPFIGYPKVYPDIKRPWRETDDTTTKLRS